jgi:hypothetical protein
MIEALARLALRQTSNLKHSSWLLIGGPIRPLERRPSTARGPFEQSEATEQGNGTKRGNGPQNGGTKSTKKKDGSRAGGPEGRAAAR